MEATRSERNGQGPATTPLDERPLVEKPAAWEMIEPGRYQPRRIRGSLLGRELG
jgi:hypothetical protein